MKAKEYLLQARYLDQQIQAKVNEIQRLNDLATHMTAVMSDMPKAQGGSTSRMEDTIVKIVDYENEIQSDLDRMITLKQEINESIRKIPETEYQLVLQERYLQMYPWEDIALDINRKVRWVQVIHGRALEQLQKILDSEENVRNA